MNHRFADFGRLTAVNQVGRDNRDVVDFRRRPVGVFTLFPLFVLPPYIAVLV